MDAGTEQGFIGIDVPHPGNYMAVHDKLLDGHDSAAAGLEQVLSGETLFKRFGSNSHKKGMIERVFACPEY